MGIAFSISYAATTNEWVWLNHGTILESAYGIIRCGLSFDKMMEVRYGHPSEGFCATTDIRVGYQYADMNPASLTPVVLGFSIPYVTLQGFQTSGLVIEDIKDQAYCFLPETFPKMNREMTNFSVKRLPELNIRFDE